MIIAWIAHGNKTDNAADVLFNVTIHSLPYYLTTFNCHLLCANLCIPFFSFLLFMSNVSRHDENAFTAELISDRGTIAITDAHETADKRG